MERLSGIEMENIIRLGFAFVVTECCWAEPGWVSSSYLVDARPRHGNGSILMCSQRVLYSVVIENAGLQERKGPNLCFVNVWIVATTFSHPFLTILRPN